MTIAMGIGSANVYADLGDAVERQRKANLVAEIAQAFKARNLAKDADKSLDQAKISKIIRGQFRAVGEEQLFALLEEIKHG